MQRGIRSSVGCVDEAELGQCLDPARGVELSGKRFIVGSGIPVIFAPFEHEEDGAENLVADGDDRSLAPTSDDEPLEL